MIKKYFGISAIAFTLVAAGCYYDYESELYPGQGADCAPAVVTYSNDVSAIISSNCNSCHSSASAQGNVVLDSYENLKNYTSNGKLSGVINHASGFSQMPKGGTKLSDCKIAIIQKWIDNGALNN